MTASLSLLKLIKFSFIGYLSLSPRIILAWPCLIFQMPKILEYSIYLLVYHKAEIRFTAYFNIVTQN